MFSLFNRSLIAILFFLTATGSRSTEAETVWDAFEKHKMEMLDQTFGKDCATLSLFNSLIIGPQDLLSSLRRLPGKQMPSKYQSLIFNYGGKYFDPNGMTLSNLADMANDLIKGQSASFHAIFVGEKPGDITVNTEQDLQASLDRHFGPILSIGFQNSPGQTEKIGHAVALLKIEGSHIEVLEPLSFDVMSFDLVENNGELNLLGPKLGIFNDPNSPNLFLQSYLIFNR